jgi:hypothetical protein
MIYNFFEETEEDTDIQEDQNKDPLLTNKPMNVPRYVELKWNSVCTTELLAGTEETYSTNKQLRDDSFATKGGVTGHDSSNFKDSIQKRKKDSNLTIKNGKPSTTVDLHEIEKAMESVSNRRLFANAIAATVNTQNQNGVINQIPTKNIKKV